MTECIEAVDATLMSIKRTLDESRRDHERFMIDMAEAQRRYDAVKRGRAE